MPDTNSVFIVYLIFGILVFDLKYHLYHTYLVVCVDRDQRWGMEGPGECFLGEWMKGIIFFILFVRMNGHA